MPHLIRSCILVCAAALAGAGEALPATASIDLAKVVRPISRDLFGSGNPGYTPYLHDSNQAIANLRRRDGQTLCRSYIGLAMALPQSTVEDFLADKDGIQNPDRWPGIAFFDGKVELLHSAGFRMILGIEESPTWNSWTGTRYGMPRDWRVHELMVQAIVRRYAGKVAMIEVKNEPDAGQTDPKGSPYPSRFAAWKDYFLHTHAALRRVDKDLPIGGPCTTGVGSQVDDGSRRTWMAAILGDAELKDKMGFWSIHTYMQPDDYPSLIARTRTKLPDYMKIIRAHFAKYQKELPVYMTEWCDHNSYQDRTLRNDPVYAPPHVATALVMMMRTGMAGAAYFAVNDAGSFRLFDLDSCYRGEPTRHGEVFRLLARDFRLDEDKGRLCETACADAGLDVAGGWSGGAEDAFAVVSNPNDEARTLQLTFSGTGWAGAAAYAESRIIDATRRGDQPGPGESVALGDGALTITVAVPAHAVVGVRANLATDDAQRWNASRPGSPAFAVNDTSTDFAAKTLYYPAFGEATGVLRTHPDSADQPARLETSVAVTAERPVLRLRAAGYAGGAWKLNVLADGAPVASHAIAGDGLFRPFHADLTAKAGKTVRLVLENADAGGTGKPFALWDAVDWVARDQAAADRWSAVQGPFADHPASITGSTPATVDDQNVLRTRPAAAGAPAAIRFNGIYVPHYRRVLSVRTRAEGSPWRCGLSVTAQGRTTTLAGTTVAGEAWSEQRFDLTPFIGTVIDLALENAAEGGAPATACWQDLDLVVPTSPAHVALAEWSKEGGLDWRIASPGEFSRLETWQQASGVLRLHPLQAGAPAMLSTRLVVPADRHHLKLVVRNEPGHDFRLRVVADHVTVLSEVIAGDTWQTRSVDLGAWVGKRIALDVIDANGGKEANWSAEACYLDAITLESGP